MQGMEFNDLWFIFEQLSEEEMAAIPKKFRDFVKECRIPGAVSEISPRIPLNRQPLSDETHTLLATVYLTYWARDPEDRRKVAEALHRNELKAQGKPVKPLTEKEYQAFLDNFEEWNERFGPIPFWAESRGRKPTEEK